MKIEAIYGGKADGTLTTWYDPMEQTHVLRFNPRKEECGYIITIEDVEIYDAEKFFMRQRLITSFVMWMRYYDKPALLASYDEYWDDDHKIELAKRYPRGHLTESRGGANDD